MLGGRHSFIVDDGDELIPEWLILSQACPFLQKKKTCNPDSQARLEEAARWDMRTSFESQSTVLNPHSKSLCRAVVQSDRSLFRVSTSLVALTLTHGLTRDLTRARLRTQQCILSDLFASHLVVSRVDSLELDP